jgi:crotonobetainyl-CoA:carnitine CoA-transferase CaiB-like acyl-CoA transferase/putative sterol carrier protein
MDVTAKEIIGTAPARFRTEKSEGIDTVFHFDISGNDGGQFTMVIENGACTLLAGLQGEAKCMITTTDVHYRDLETGKLNPQLALMMGKVKVSSLTEMMAFSKLFRKFDVQYLSGDFDKSSLLEEVVRPELNGPLKGVRILDFSRLLPGPLATMLLADMGADVIKIEDPDNPDYIRDFEPMMDGTSAFYYALNRSKKSLAVNYLEPEGKQIIYELVKSTDVVVEQYRPGVMKALGLDYETLKSFNPKLIYASITGYGQASSMAQVAGHDLNYIALAGLLGMNGQNADSVVIPGFQLADIAGGSYVAMNAILAALFQRERRGVGEHLDIAMADAVVPLTALPFAEYQATGKVTERGTFQLSGGLANYNVFRCADGKFIALGSLEPKFWNQICVALNKPEWINVVLEDQSAHDAVKIQLKSMFQEQTRDYWVTFFKGKDVCVSAVNEIDELTSNPYLQEKNVYTKQKICGKDFHTVNMPVVFEASKENSSWIAPKLGEDTIAILRNMNMSESEIQRLRALNIVRL